MGVERVRRAKDPVISVVIPTVPRTAMKPGLERRLREAYPSGTRSC